MTRAKNRLDDRALGGAMRRALVKMGKAVPRTAEEVALFEVGIDLNKPRLPSELDDPWACLDPARRRSQAGSVGKDENEEVNECLARAAREGGHIPEDLEKKMEADRAQAEAEANDEDSGD